MALEASARLQQLVGQYMDQWKIDGYLGGGSYGTVYRIRRREGDFVSALKWIPFPRDDSEPARLRQQGWTQEQIAQRYRQTQQTLQDEINIMDHFHGNSHIVSMEDHRVVERPAGEGFDLLIRMELLTPLSSLISSLTVQDVVSLGVDVCAALMDCEQVNVLHRDIKPDNILRNRFGAFKLGDFGVARSLRSGSNAHTQKGTPFFMAPEVYAMNAQGYDHRADLYSLGLVLYQLLNAQTIPFCTTTDQMPTQREEEEAFEKRLRGEHLPAPLQAPASLAQVVLKACAYNPDERYASAGAMRQALLDLGKVQGGDNKLLLRSQTSAFLSSRGAAGSAPQGTMPLNTPSRGFRSYTPQKQEAPPSPAVHNGTMPFPGVQVPAAPPQPVSGYTPQKREAPPAPPKDAPGVTMPIQGLADQPAVKPGLNGTIPIKGLADQPAPAVSAPPELPEAPSLPEISVGRALCEALIGAAVPMLIILLFTSQVDVKGFSVPRWLEESYLPLALPFTIPLLALILNKRQPGKAWMPALLSSLLSALGLIVCYAMFTQQVLSPLYKGVGWWLLWIRSGAVDTFAAWFVFVVMGVFAGLWIRKEHHG